MAQVIPFNAVRPKKKLAAEFCSKSIDFYSDDELKNILDSKPNSFVQIIKPNIKKNTKLTIEERYQDVKKTYEEFKNKGILVKDSKAAYYIYEIKSIGFSFCGILAGVSVEDYKNGVIKKHENTIEKREKIFKQYLKTTRFNSEPVLLTYDHSKNLSDLIAECKLKKPTVNFKTSDAEEHTIWLIDSSKIVKKLKAAFKTIPSLYIADGHHRSASSVLLSNEEKKIAKDNQRTNFFMAYLIPDNELIIREYNRVFTNLNGFSENDFLEQLKQKFNVSMQGYTKQEKLKTNSFKMYLKGQFYDLSLRNNTDNSSNPLLNLDAYILQEMILKPILGVKNPRRDKRLNYSSNSDIMLGIKSVIDKGQYAVGFGLKPVTIGQLKTIADANLVMPPKSTYIFPKLRNGITIYEF